MSPRQSVSLLDRGRFMAYAAQVMRGLIVDHARHRCAQKRGAGFEVKPLDEGVVGEPVDDRDLERIGAAVDELAALDARWARRIRRWPMPAGARRL